MRTGIACDIPVIWKLLPFSTMLKLLAVLGLMIGAEDSYTAFTVMALVTLVKGVSQFLNM